MHTLRELSCERHDHLVRTRPSLNTPVERAQRMFGMLTAKDRQPESASGPARPAFDAPVPNLSLRSSMQWTESQPTTEVLGGRKPAHIRPDLTEDHQCRA